MRRLVGLLLVDAVLLVGLVIGASLSLEKVSVLLEEQAGLSQALAEELLIGGVVVLALPFLVGIIRIARRLAGELAGRLCLSERRG